ncbi:MAG: hypothetical protein ACM3ZT_00605 [Bacillota bacterium]
MKRNFGKQGWLGLALFLCCALVGTAAQGGDASGRLGVGITILETCHYLASVAAAVPSQASVTLKCTPGSAYTVQISAGGESSPGNPVEGITTVTLRF